MSGHTPAKKGDHGVHVGRVQTLLVKRKLLKELQSDGKPSVDGHFGPATADAVAEFQRQNDLSPTGIVDFTTWRKLNPFRTVSVSGKLKGDHGYQIPPTMRLLPGVALHPPSLVDLTLHSLPDHPANPAGGLPGPGGPLSMRRPTPSRPKDDSDVVNQPQAATQYLSKPLYYNMPRGATRPGQSLTLQQFQFWVTYRSAQDGMHLEFGAGGGLSIMHKFAASDSRYSIAGNLSITIADIFVYKSWHLVSPQLQLSVYENTDDKMNVSSRGATINVGNQMSYELKKDSLMLMLTPGFWMGYDFKTGQVTVAPGFAVGVGGTFK